MRSQCSKSLAILAAQTVDGQSSAPVSKVLFSSSFLGFSPKFGLKFERRSFCIDSKLIWMKSRGSIRIFFILRLMDKILHHFMRCPETCTDDFCQSSKWDQISMKMPFDHLTEHSKTCSVRIRSREPEVPTGKNVFLQKVKKCKNYP